MDRRCAVCDRKARDYIDAQVAHSRKAVVNDDGQPDFVGHVDPLEYEKAVFATYEWTHKLHNVLVVNPNEMD